jgi:exodeoxyribonuclease VII large subunit
MQVRSVSQVTREIKTLIDGQPWLADLWVAGQVSTFHRASSGHWYFTLIDEESELRCVIWKGLAARVPRMPAQGEMVDAHGYLSVYERGGYYQFYADTLEPAGIGALWEQFARLKARLEAEGLFDSERKRPLPLRPRRIGVVTSPTGAALQDILKVLRGRYPLVEVVVSPTLVQGQEAPEGIARAIERLNGRPDVDLIIVARGGGSLEDLWSFNDERVARAIAGTRVPVVTGIGHETDITIADLVADVRAPTPTAAAATVVPDGVALRAWVHGAPFRLQAALDARIAELRGRLAQDRRLLRTLHPMRLIAERRQRLDDRLQRLTAMTRHGMSLQRAALDTRVARLNGLDARQVLGRGYALVQLRSTGERLGSVHQVGPGDGLVIEVRDGRVVARVFETHPRQTTGGDSAS